MEKKATFIRAIPGNTWQHTDLVYEYRGHQYIVTKHNNGYAFDGLAAQHKREQEAIDQRIADAGKPAPEWHYEGSAQEGFDLLWKYFEEE